MKGNLFFPLIAIFLASLVYSCQNEPIPTKPLESLNDKFFYNQIEPVNNLNDSNDVFLKKTINLKKENVSIYLTSHNIYLKDNITKLEYFIDDYGPRFDYKSSAYNSVSHRNYLSADTINFLEKNGYAVEWTTWHNFMDFKGLEDFLDSRYKGGQFDQEFSTIMDSILAATNYARFENNLFYKIIIKKIFDETKNYKRGKYSKPYLTYLHALNHAALLSKFNDTFIYKSKVDIDDYRFFRFEYRGERISGEEFHSSNRQSMFTFKHRNYSITSYKINL